METHTDRLLHQRWQTLYALYSVVYLIYTQSTNLHRWENFICSLSFASIDFIHSLTHLLNSLSLSLLWFYHFAWWHGRGVRKRSRVHFIIITKCLSAKTLDEKVIISFYYYYCHSCCLAWLCFGIRVSYFSHTCETI